MNTIINKSDLASKNIGNTVVYINRNDKYCRQIMSKGLNLKVEDMKKYEIENFESQNDAYVVIENTPMILKYYAKKGDSGWMAFLFKNMEDYKNNYQLLFEDYEFKTPEDRQNFINQVKKINNF